MSTRFIHWAFKLARQSKQGMLNEKRLAFFLESLGQIPAKWSFTLGRLKSFKVAVVLLYSKLYTNQIGATNNSTN